MWVPKLCVVFMSSCLFQWFCSTVPHLWWLWGSRVGRLFPMRMLSFSGIWMDLRPWRRLQCGEARLLADEVVRDGCFTGYEDCLGRKGRTPRWAVMTGGRWEGKQTPPSWPLGSFGCILRQGICQRPLLGRVSGETESLSHVFCVRVSDHL